VLPRSDWGHLQKAYLPAHLLSAFFVAWLISKLGDAVRRRQVRRVAGLVAAVVVSLVLPALQLAANLGSPGSILFALHAAPRFESVHFPHGELRMRPEHARELTEVIAIVEDRRRQTAHSEIVQMLTFPAGAIFNFLFGIPTPLRYDALRPGELRNNHPDIIDDILVTFRRTEPLFLIRTSENSNPGLTRKLDQASREAYTRHPTARLQLYERR
jgi:hypothetical protein